MKFHSFKDKIPENGGFLVLRYGNSFGLKKEKYVWADKPTHHYGHSWSFYTCLPGITGDGEIDSGLYEWTAASRFDEWKVTDWRYMTTEEESEYRKKLYRFDRPKKPWPK